ncbi:Phosphatidylinositol 4-kinase pik1alpha (PI4-kinase)(PtdIns-4-kinase), partial [Globomyces sp. JEL0801]
MTSSASSSSNLSISEHRNSKKSEPESWLLRLFESDFFDSRLALSHIIISRPHESAALEDFIMSICQTSNHMAILTLWYLESYLNDLQTVFTIQSDSYQLCKRLHLKCQTIIFADASEEENMVQDVQQMSADMQLSAHIPPTVVGIGLMLASLSTPIIAQNHKSIILSQGKQLRFDNPFGDEDSDSEYELRSQESVEEFDIKRSITEEIFSRIPQSSPTIEELAKGSAFSFKSFVRKTSRFHERSPSSASLVSNPTPFITAESEGYSKSLDIPDEGHRLLNSHYFHSEIQFIMTLVDISERLVPFPKHSRQSSLIAELTLLNHNLPANVCIPFWCPSEICSQKHHQIVRITLSDCVVLNSADRVPFLMIVEVIETLENVKRKFTLPSQRKNSTTKEFKQESPTKSRHSVDSVKSNRDSAEYYLSVISRRQSVTEMATQQPEYDMSLKPIKSVNQDEFSDRMRTAAVMLAQLYQQQQKKDISLNMKGSRSSTPSRTPSYSLESLKGGYSAPSSPRMSVSNDHKRQLSNFEEIRSRVIREMTALEASRLETLSSQHGGPIDPTAADELLPHRQEEALHGGAIRDDDDPSASVFREPWETKKKRIQAASPYGSDPNWQLYSVIVKSGADLRQEQLALQLISEIQQIWKSFNLNLWVYPFRILITSNQSGLIEVIPDSISIHSIKKDGYVKNLNQPGIAYTLYDHFIKEFGQPGCENFRKAQENFIQSLAAYSIICYLLQIKDRHNGNILLDLEGHITHIDFGFMLMNSPGSVGFELAPFKLPQEYIDIMGGYQSERFEYFRQLMKEGFLALRKRSDSVLGLLEIMEKDSRLPCFTGITNKPNAIPVAPPPTSDTGSMASRYPVTHALRERFQLVLTDDAFCEHIDRLIESSCNNMFTKLYDSFQ